MKITLKEIILSAVGFILSYILKGEFKESLCEINFFGCFVGFLAYTLPVIIIVVYWMIKFYPVIKKYLTK